MATLGGIDGILALRGLFVLMTKHNLEYPRLYPQLYALVTADALSGAHRATFAEELQLFLSSTGLPAYLLASVVNRLARLALSATPSGAALGCGLAYRAPAPPKRARSGA